MLAAQHFTPSLKVLAATVAKNPNGIRTHSRYGPTSIVMPPTRQGTTQFSTDEYDTQKLTNFKPIKMTGWYSGARTFMFNFSNNGLRRIVRDENARCLTD